MIENKEIILPTIPLQVTLKHSLQLAKNPIPIFRKFTEQYGPTFIMKAGNTLPTIFTVEPAIIQHILQKNHRNYEKSKLQTETLGQFTGKDLLTSTGNYWLKQRRLIQPGFHRKKLAVLTEVMNEVVDKFVIDFDKKAEKEDVFDITDDMLNIAFDMVAQSLFGSDVPPNFLSSFSENITTLQETFAKLLREPYLKWWFHLNGRIRNTHNKAKASTDLFLGIIRKRKASKVEKEDLLDMLLKARYEDTGEGMNDHQLAREAQILFNAGHETTANALSWLFYLLSQHPTVVQKLRTELDSVLGNRKPTFSDIPNLVYSRAVIEEVMRLYPPAWLTDRVALADDEVQGYKIPKGTIIMALIYGVHHAEANWESPDDFKPERFLKDNKKKHTPFAYLPFGGGPRQCIGNNFAMMEMQLILTAMVRRFDFELGENQKIEMLPLLTLRPKYGIKMKLKFRK